MFVRVDDVGIVRLLLEPGCCSTGMMNLYHKLLEIPESETPPDHYGLLGVPRFTDDAQVIHDALVTRSTQLRSWDNSKLFREANALLDEVVAAAFILEDPIRKAAYDTELRLRLGLSEAEPVALADLVKFVETPIATKVYEYEEFKEPDEEPLPEPPAGRSKPPGAGPTPHGKETSNAEAEKPETNYDGLFLKIGGALIAVTLLIAVPVVVWTGRKPTPIAAPSQTVTPIKNTETVDETTPPTPGATAEILPMPAAPGPPKTQPGAAAFAGPAVPNAGATPLGTVPAGAGASPSATASSQSPSKLSVPKRVLTFDTPGEYVAVAVTEDQSRVLSASKDGAISLWNLADGKLISNVSRRGEWTSVELSKNGRIAIMPEEVGNNVHAVVWDVAAGREIGRIGGPAFRFGASAAFSADEKEIIFASSSITVFRPSVGKTPQSSPDWLSAGTFTSGRGTTVSITGRFPLAVSPLAAGGVYFAADDNPNEIRHCNLEVTFDLQKIRTGLQAQRIREFDKQSEIRRLLGHGNPVESLAISQNGQRLLSRDQTGVTIVWDTGKGKELGRLSSNQWGTFALSPDGRYAVFRNQGLLQEWDVDRQVVTSDIPLIPLASRACNARYLADGRRILICAYNGLELWELPRPESNAVAAAPVTPAGPSAPSTDPPVAGDEFTNTVGMKLKRVPAGEFLMGSSPADVATIKAADATITDRSLAHEQPQRRVLLTKPIWMGPFEVTQSEYAKVMGINPSSFQPGGAGANKVTAGLDPMQFPVEQVSWLDAAEFCNKLSLLEWRSPCYRLSNTRHSGRSLQSATVALLDGNGYRLPTEAEWEYVCRAGTTTLYQFGNSASGLDANVRGDTPFGTTDAGPFLQRTTTVNSYSANPFGFHNLHGNVGEWCQDWYAADAYQTGDQTQPLTDPQGPSSGQDRVLRGGSWSDAARNDRAALRRKNGPGARLANCGFRVVLVDGTVIPVKPEK